MKYKYIVKKFIKPAIREIEKEVIKSTLEEIQDIDEDDIIEAISLFGLMAASAALSIASGAVTGLRDLINAW